MCFPIEFKEASRVRLCKMLVGLEACCIILAKLLGHHGFRYRKSFRLYTSLVEGYDAGALPLLLMVTGLLTSVVNLYGIYVAFRSMYPSLRHRMLIQMKIYIRVVSVVIMFLLVCGFFCFLQQSLIDDTFKNGILSALKRYRTDPKIKEDIDRLQLQFMCCGNEKYTDWFQVNWISEEYVDVSLPEERKQMRSGAYETDDVPFSCCNPEVKRPCINRNVHDNRKNFNYVYQKDLTLFKDGCRPVLVQEADRLVAFIFCITVLLLFLETSIAILVRHFVTSVKSAIELGDPTATTYGYFLRSFLVMAEELGGSRGNYDSRSSSANPSAAPSTTVPFGAPPPPPPPPPHSPLLSKPARSLQPARRLFRRPSYPVVPVDDRSGYNYTVDGVTSPRRPSPPQDDTVSQLAFDTNDFPYGRTYVEQPSPLTINPVTTPVPSYAQPAIAGPANDGFGSEYPGRRGSRSPSVYDQSSRRTSTVPGAGSFAREPDLNTGSGPPANDQFRTRESLGQMLLG